MDLVIIILGILYLCDFKVGVALAICSIIEGICVMVLSILKELKK